MMLNIINKRKYFYVASGALLIVSMVVLSLWGLKFNIDFTGGTTMLLKFSQDVKEEQAQEVLQEMNLNGLTLEKRGQEMTIKYLGSNDDINNQVFEKMKGLDEEVVQESLDFIGASVSDQLKKNALIAVILGVIGIALYIAWAFRKVSRPVSSWKYGLGAVIALFHDILITLGIFTLLGKIWSIEVGVPFVAALLTILGYSVNDTIVVYDRTRENILKSSSKENFEDTVNKSLNETLARSINTSLTVLIVLVFLIILGSEAIRWFSVTLFIGVALGTYSSIYVASAFLVSIHKWQQKNK